MSSHVVYACRCLNIKIHLATKYTTATLDQLKQENHVTEPHPGWQFELGIGGIKIVSDISKSKVCLTDHLFSFRNSVCLLAQSKDKTGLQQPALIAI